MTGPAVCRLGEMSRVVRDRGATSPIAFFHPSLRAKSRFASPRRCRIAELASKAWPGLKQLALPGPTNERRPATGLIARAANHGEMIEAMGADGTGARSRAASGASGAAVGRMLERTGRRRGTAPAARIKSVPNAGEVHVRNAMPSTAPCQHAASC